MSSAFSIKISVAEITAVADKLGVLADAPLGEKGLGIVNRVATDTFERAVPRMVKVVNLTDQYVRSHMSVSLATNPLHPVATIRANGGPGDMTPLSRYGATQMWQPTVRPNRAKGDQSHGRNIPQGRKGAGVRVSVKRGSAATLEWAFLMPLRAGNLAGGNGVGVFTRSKDGTLVRHRYGPSVYQLFREAAGELEVSVGDELEQAVMEEAERQLARSLE